MNDLSFEFLLIVSTLAGFVGALSGMGGGIVLTPVLTFFGMDIKQAIAVSMISVIATSSGSASAYLLDRVTNIRIGMFLEMFTISGALVGALITLSAPARPLYLAFGAVLLVSWGVLFLRRGGPARKKPHADRFSRRLGLSGRYYDEAQANTLDYEETHAAAGGLLMLAAGLIAGLLGIGADALKLLVMDVVMNVPAKVATTTSNLIIGVTALAGASVYLAAGVIDVGLAAPVVIGDLIGAAAGTRRLLHLGNHTIKVFFLFLLALLGCEMIVRGFNRSPRVDARNKTERQRAESNRCSVTCFLPACWRAPL